MPFKSNRQRKWCFASGVCKGKRWRKKNKFVTDSELPFKANRWLDSKEEAKQRKKAEEDIKKKTGVPNVDLEGFSPQQVKIAKETFEELHEEFPEVANTLFFYGTDKGFKRFAKKYNKDNGEEFPEDLIKEFRVGTNGQTAANYDFRYPDKKHRRFQAIKIDDNFWNDSAQIKRAEEAVASGFSRSMALHDVITHEFGHALDNAISGDSWTEADRHNALVMKLRDKGITIQKIAHDISGYAATSIDEYIAESFADGRSYRIPKSKWPESVRIGYDYLIDGYKNKFKKRGKS